MCFLVSNGARVWLLGKTTTESNRDSAHNDRILFKYDKNGGVDICDL